MKYCCNVNHDPKNLKCSAISPYCIIYLLVAVLVTAVTLSLYAVFLQAYIAVHYSFYFELAMVFGQVLFQSLWLWKRSLAIKQQYVFHLLTVSLLGSALLWLYISIVHVHPLSPYVALAYFFVWLPLCLASTNDGWPAYNYQLTFPLPGYYTVSWS